MQTIGIAGNAVSSLGQKSDAAASPRLVRAAQEFEGQMMKELLKPMTDGDGLTGTDDDSDSGAGSEGALGEFASQALGQSLSQHGGFGMANRIVHELSHSGHQPGNQVESGKVTKNGHQLHGMRASQ